MHQRNNALNEFGSFNDSQSRVGAITFPKLSEPNRTNAEKFTIYPSPLSARRDTKVSRFYDRDDEDIGPNEDKTFGTSSRFIQHTTTQFKKDL